MSTQKKSGFFISRFLRSFPLAMVLGLLVLTGCSMPTISSSGSNGTGTTNQFGSIGGRVLVSGRSASNVLMSIESLDSSGVTKSVCQMASTRPSARSTLAPTISRDILAQSTTDASGHYTFDNLQPGAYTIYASDPGTLEKAVMANLTVGAGNRTIASDLNLTAVGSISGKVSLGQATGNLGILVFIAGTSYLAVTDDSGSYTISNVPTGPGYLLVAKNEGYQTSTGQQVTVAANLVTSAPSVTLAQITTAPPTPTTGTLTGSISVPGNGSGAKSGIIVYLSGTQFITVTGTDGTFSLTGVPANSYTLATASTGASYSVYSQPVQVKAGQATAVGTITLASPSLSFAVTYDANGGVGTVPVDSNLYGPGSYILYPPVPGSLTRAGWFFDGWNTCADGTGTYWAGSDSAFFLTGNTVLYAVWSKGIDIAFDGNGSSGGVAPASLLANVPGTRIILPGAGSLSNGTKSFMGWSENASGGANLYSPQGSYLVWGFSRKLYAQWANPISVTYDANGADSGTVPTDTNSYDYRDQIVVLGNPGNLKKAGYVFSGWLGPGNNWTMSPGTTFAASAASGMGSNLVLEASWTVPVTVTYNANGATSGTVPVDSNLYPSNQEIMLASNSGGLAKSGLIFSGWNTKADGSGTSYSASNWAWISSSMVLYAQWSNGISITYDANGGVGTAPVDGNLYVTNTWLYLLDPSSTGNPISKANYVFSGWSLTPGGSPIANNQLYYSGNASITVYAVWVVPMTVTFDFGDGTASIWDTNQDKVITGSVLVSPTHYVPGATVSLYPIYTVTSTPAGKTTILGWSMTKGGPMQYGISGAIYNQTQSFTLYAVWG